jgi:hypothetical protein
MHVFVFYCLFFVALVVFYCLFFIVCFLLHVVVEQSSPQVNPTVSCGELWAWSTGC